MSALANIHSTGNVPPPAPTEDQINAAAASASQDERWRIKDLDCVPQNDEAKPRQHEFMIAGRPRTLSFTYGVGVPLPVAVAVKLLKHPNFVRVGDDGEEMTWKNPPRQPDEYGAGERLKLAEDQTIASYDELTAEALKIRAAQLPGGEVLRTANKADVIAFIVKVTAERRALNTAVDPDALDRDAWMPDAASETELFGADS